ncbi:aldo/keto reductase [Actinoplanes sp. NPDC051513]|uniref:aldo/keto reductase n=1 Tax=Actinoplanes sp. NPDC051513 TaxID=3363908 RepID=UPI003787768D
MSPDLTELRDLLTRHAGQTALDRVTVLSSTTPTEPMTGLLSPTLVVVAQGSKRTTIAEHVLTYGAGDFLIASLDLPVVAHVEQASRSAPYLVVGVPLRPELIAELVLHVPAHAVQEGIGFAVGRVTGDLLDPLVRLLRLLDRPADIPVLAAGIERELVWRLLTGDRHAGRILPAGPYAGRRTCSRWHRSAASACCPGARCAAACCPASGPGGAAAETTRSWVRPTESDYAVIDVLDEVAAESGHTPAAVALSWVQNRPAITSTLIGARRLDQLRVNLDAVDVALTADQTARLDAVSTPALNFPADNNRTLAPDLAFAGATVDGASTKVPVALAALLNR